MSTHPETKRVDELQDCEAVELPEWELEVYIRAPQHDDEINLALVNTLGLVTWRPPDTVVKLHTAEYLRRLGLLAEDGDDG